MAAAPAGGLALRRAHLPADDRAALVNLTVGQLLAQRADSHAGNRRSSGSDTIGSPARLTYAQLYDEAARVATALSALAERGSYVALWAPNIVEWAVIQYGAALAGMVLVALNPALRAEELEYALAHSRASVLLHADTNRDDDLAEVVASMAPGLPNLMCISLSERERWQAAEVSSAVLAPRRPTPTSP